MKIIITEKQLELITEAITQTDKSEIERMIRKEIKDTLDDNKFKKKIKDLMDTEHKSREFEQKLIELNKNVLVQLFKQMYNKRSFWASGLSNTSS